MDQGDERGCVFADETMTLPEPMLANIIASPADDGPRLVAADYLEERGACDRAEFVRVQCEMARKGPVTQDGYTWNDSSPLCDRTTCDVCPLRRRATELLAENEAKWVRQELNQSLVEECGRCCGTGHFGNDKTGEGSDFKCSQCNSAGLTIINHIKFHWHRGFVSQVECRLADWRGETCIDCSGAGFTLPRRDSFKKQDCPTCHGIGRTGGLGPILVRRAPIERVAVTDKTCIDINNRWVWGNQGTCPQDQANEPDGFGNYLPDDVWKKLDGNAQPPRHSHETWCWFTSADAANRALSDALLAEARGMKEESTHVV